MKVGHKIIKVCAIGQCDAQTEGVVAVGDGGRVPRGEESIGDRLNCRDQEPGPGGIAYVRERNFRGDKSIHRARPVDRHHACQRLAGRGRRNHHRRLGRDGQGGQEQEQGQEKKDTSHSVSVRLATSESNMKAGTGQLPFPQMGPSGKMLPRSVVPFAP